MATKNRGSSVNDGIKEQRKTIDEVTKKIVEMEGKLGGDL